jgi:hypothetical protein
MLNQKSGMLFGGLDGLIAPFHGGFRCTTVSFRTLPQDSGGSTGGIDCSGSYGFAITPAFASAHASVGSTLSVQFWSRDPGFAWPDNAGLSAALRFVNLP